MNITRNLPAAHSASTSEFADKLGEIKNLIAELAKCAPDAAQENINAFSKQATAKATDAAKVVVKTVKENPIPVALAAIGTGLVAWYVYSLVSKNSDK